MPFSNDSNFKLRVASCAVMLALSACADDNEGRAGLQDAGIPASDASADGNTAIPDGGVYNDPDSSTYKIDASVPDSAAVPCMASAADGDGDGVTAQAGDCNDCDKNVNPGAYDVPGNNVDEDCSGKADDEPANCDQSLPIEANDPLHGARALGLCRDQRGTSWGLKSAKWVYPDGTTSSLGEEGCVKGRPPAPLSRGVLSTFAAANKPREGASMLVLSSGVAREGVVEIPAEELEKNLSYGRSPAGATLCVDSLPPPGFPIETPGCNQPSTKKFVHDGIGLELELKVPTNATALAFDFDFFTTEFPRYVCTRANDHFVALLWSSHPGTPANHNVSFDTRGNVVSVNSAFVQACEPVTLFGRTFECPRGVAELVGTGFDERMSVDSTSYVAGGATSWLKTLAPVVPGETIKLRLTIWDTGDSISDSTVLLDHLRFVVQEGAQPPVMKPVTTVVLL